MNRFLFFLSSRPFVEKSKKERCHEVTTEEKGG
jgi:hypothetical protein